jgi:NADP+-dependent farnesol dehydrogenase
MIVFRYQTSILTDEENSFSQLKEVIDTNLSGLVQCSQEAFKIMKNNDDYGFIININSVVGHNIPFVNYSMNVYPSTKFAVTATTEVMRQELVNMKNDKIRVAVSIKSDKTD